MARAMVAAMFATARVTSLAIAPVPLQCPVSRSNVWDAMGEGTMGENVRRRIPISKAEEEKTEERDGGRANGTEVRAAKAKEEKGKDTEVKAKERAKDTEVKEFAVLILWGRIHGEAKAHGAASKHGQIKISATIGGENMKEPDISDHWPR